MEGSVSVLVPILGEYEFTFSEVLDFIKKNENNILWEKKNEYLKEMYQNYMQNPPSSPLKLLRKNKSNNL